MKDTPADRRSPRERLVESLDAIFKPKIDPKYNVDAVEPKLFGIGAESYTPGSHEFYLGYAVSRQVLLTLDAGHFHPTEGIADKISSVLCYLPEIALHVSRGVRWDSDHVVTLTDDLEAIAQEIVWAATATASGLAWIIFDASINRVAAWVVGARNMLKALLLALVAPIDQLKQFELESDYTSRLALMEDARMLPSGAVWDYYCQSRNVPVGADWLRDVKTYERHGPGQTQLNSNPEPDRYESRPRSFLPLAWRPGVRQFLCPLPRRQKMGLGSVLAGGWFFLLDHRALDPVAALDQ